MTRVNQPDSLLSELRDIKRRLRALETRSAGGTVPPAAAASERVEPAQQDDPAAE